MPNEIQWENAMSWEISLNFLNNYLLPSPINSCGKRLTPQQNKYCEKERNSIRISKWLRYRKLVNSKAICFSAKKNKVNIFWRSRLVLCLLKWCTRVVYVGSLNSNFSVCIFFSLPCFVLYARCTHKNPFATARRFKLFVFSRFCRFDSSYTDFIRQKKGI